MTKKLSDVGQVIWNFVKVSLGIIAFIFITSTMINIIVNYSGYDYKYLGPSYNQSTDRVIPYDEFRVKCKEICGDLPEMTACPCSHCGCWCIKHEYFGFTRDTIRKQCEVY